VTALRLQPGHVLAGKYSIRTLLGYGGATASYGAVTAQGRQVVVKLFSPQLADRADVIAALQRAAGVTNALPAPATAAILDVGFDPQTRSPFTVTDAMTAPSLLDAVRGGPLSPPDVAALVRGVAVAVDAAHAQRLAHGGLKPQNVFVGLAPGPPPSVRVMDFGVGLARACVPTDDGRRIAAPWLAPEQLQGGVDGPGVDVFAAGLLAFFAATGRPYWRSCQGAVPDLAAWQQELLSARVPASMRAQELGSSLSPAWDAVLARALAHNPAERFGSVGELANALAATAGASGHVPAPVVAPIAAPPLAAPVMLAPPVTPAAAPAVAAASGLDLPVEPPPKSKAGLWIGLAVGGVVLVGAVVAVVATRKPPVAANGGAPSASAAPATSVPSAAPSASAAADVPALDAGAATAAEAVADAAEEPVQQLAQLTVTCVPDCDTLTIDDDVLDAGLTDPQALPPGSHTLVAAKATYLSQTRKVVLKAGQREKATFFMSKPGTGPAPTKTCGKFLERCP
jgi:hypothetical protein